MQSLRSLSLVRNPVSSKNINSMRQISWGNETKYYMFIPLSQGKFLLIFSTLVAVQIMENGVGENFKRDFFSLPEISQVLPVFNPFKSSDSKTVRVLVLSKQEKFVNLFTK